MSLLVERHAGYSVSHIAVVWGVFQEYCMVNPRNIHDLSAIVVRRFV